MNKYLIAFVSVLLIVGAVFFFDKKQDKKSISTSLPIVTPFATIKPVEETKVEGLKIEDLVVGTGIEAISGKKISVHYTGTLTNGTKFDSSKDRGTPFSFTLGAGQVIQGWDKGFAGMKVGGKRKLTIAPEMGYGNQPVGSIPANSTLIFEVELLGVE